jgi:hypothetical protein
MRRSRLTDPSARVRILAALVALAAGTTAAIVVILLIHTVLA